MASKKPKQAIDTSLLVYSETFCQLQLIVTDPAQERYEVAWPLLLGQPLTATQRAQQTQNIFSQEVVDTALALLHSRTAACKTPLR